MCGSSNHGIHHSSKSLAGYKGFREMVSQLCSDPENLYQNDWDLRLGKCSRFNVVGMTVAFKL